MASSQYRSRSTVGSWSLSNLDKVLYPAAGFRKADVIDYYRRIAPVMLPHLAGRPPTLVRAPDGPDGERFFEKRCPPHHPDVGADRGGRRRRRPAGLRRSRSSPALVWLANLAALELHTHQWTVADPWHPTAVVLDLDPGPPADVARLRPGRARAARPPRPASTCAVVVKTSGGKGLHLSVPLNTGTATHEETKRFALALGQLLESRDPKRVTVDMAKEQADRAACSSTGARTTATRRRCARTRCASASGRRCRRRCRGTRSTTRSTAATTTRSRSRPPTSLDRVERARRPVRRHAHRAPGTPSALGRLPRQTARRCSRVRLPAAWDRFH